MGWKEAAEPVLTRMPAVRRPEGHVPFKDKLMWSAGILMLYFFLTNITLLGLQSGQANDLFGQFRAILAGSQGSVLQVGIGPIVTASIVLQLLGGANLLGLDTDDPRDQVLYQGLQKLLVVVMIFLTGLPMVFAGGFLPADPQLAATFPLGSTGVKWLIFAQIFVGAILVLFMDEIISKWGVGSGIGLFIVAGVSQKLIGGLFAWGGLPGRPGLIPNWIAIATGNAGDIPSLLTAQGIQYLLLDGGGILALVTTVLIFSI